MTRGNQRDTDRARAQARQAKHAKGTTQGNPLAKREADAKALQEKIARKAAMKAEGGDVNTSVTNNKSKNSKQQDKKK
ncbi:hypothetical protein KXD40_009662 [Peronospora effusa]|uniref:Small EDRK-rich factor-like N-terminal domain-containing protein n=1 Tax=Peronospora effusa TaxID=542832 RepID=A0A3M6VWM6_9STRA|nr:hypothetical protein DD238_001890 [Peronospora effusa]RQM17170.1 hypothetical protein DD237_002543 [Peronospora effusa]UIZ23828.1 hypothetical protein KXD40_009662 [Peronospora effusa]CAI5706065.1 unnamed protein product [Peronospora effusa]